VKALLFGAAAAVGIGVWMVASLGPALLDPLFLIPFACLAAFFVRPDEGPLWKALLGPLALMGGILAVALVLLNLDPPRNTLPGFQTVLGAGALSVSFAYLAAALFRWIAGMSSTNVARWSLRGGMLALYCVYRWMPPEWLVRIGEGADRWGVAIPSLFLALLFVGAAVLISRRSPLRI
jgi:hypothetical protein